MAQALHYPLRRGAERSDWLVLGFATVDTSYDGFRGLMIDAVSLKVGSFSLTPSTGTTVCS